MTFLGRKQALGQVLVGTQLVAVLDFLGGLEVMVALVVITDNLLELIDAALDFEDMFVAVESFLDDTRTFDLGRLEIAVSGRVIFIRLHSNMTERAIILLLVGNSSALDGGTDGENNKDGEGGLAKLDHLESRLRYYGK